MVFEIMLPRYENDFKYMTETIEILAECDPKTFDLGEYLTEDVTNVNYLFESNYFDKELVKKVPKKLLEKFKIWSKKKYNYMPKNYSDLEMSAQYLLDMIDLAYWCKNDQEKMKILSHLTIIYHVQ